MRPSRADVSIAGTAAESGEERGDIGAIGLAKIAMVAGLALYALLAAFGNIIVADFLLVTVFVTQKEE